VNRGEQDAWRRRDPAIEAELPDRNIMRKRLGVRRADRGKEAKGDRKIVMRALLGEVGRRQVHRDSLGRKRQSDGCERRTDAFAALGNRFAGKPTMMKAGSPDESWTCT